MATRKPAQVFSPGEILKEELEEREWTQGDLAEIIGKHVHSVNDIVVGKRGITPDMARALSQALGTSAELWMNLDAAYQLARVKEDDSGAIIARRAKLYAKAPVKDMIRRNWIEPSDDVNILESRVCQFFQIPHIDDEPVLPRYAARRSTSYTDPPSPSQLAWLFRARQLSSISPARQFTGNGLGDVVDNFRRLLHAPQEIRYVPRILDEVGIRFVIVQPLPGGRIDGACLWIDGAPTIAMSLRFDRIDNFWFVLLHELDHVVKHQDSLDTDMEATAHDDKRPAIEHEADEFAVEALVPQRQLESFIARVGPFYSTTRIEAFAHTMGVHPAIVIGQLQHRGEVAYSSYRKLMAPVRDWIVGSALTDGWNVTLPAAF